MCAQRYNPGMTWTRLALLTGICLGASAQARIPIILDTDLGDSIDDALALAFALQSPELDVRAVTTVIDDVESKTRLAWKMLGVYNRRDIALAMGASEPLLDPTTSAPSTSRSHAPGTAGLPRTILTRGFCQGSREDRERTTHSSRPPRPSP